MNIMKLNQQNQPSRHPSKMKCGLLLIAFLNFSLCEKLLKFYKTECNFNPKYMTNATCNLRMKSRNTVVANVDFDVVIPMKNLYITGVYYKFYNQFRPFLFNESAGTCDIADGSFSTMKGISYYGKTIARIASKFTNAIVCNYKVSK